MVDAWHQQRLIGVFPAFIRVEGTRAEELSGGGAERAAEVEADSTLHYTTQEPVHTDHAAEGAGVQCWCQGKRRVPAVGDAAG